MKIILRFLICFFFLIPNFVLAQGAAPSQKQRVIVLTDIENEPDDAESLVRFLTYSNNWDVEGLVATTSVHLQNHVAPEKIRQIVSAYGKVRPNLLLHESGFPSEEYLNSVLTHGPSVYGMAAISQNTISPGAELIIKAVDKQDSRPVWVLVWGGPNTLAQALSKVKATRSKRAVRAFVSKLRVYAISDQDDTGPWIRNTFPDLFYIVSPGMHAGGAYHMATWSGISGDNFWGRFVGADFSIEDKPWLHANVMSKGPLGAEYPEPKFLMEGDTPSFLYLIDNGLSSPENPNWGSWGGRYELYKPPYHRWLLVPETRPIWTDAVDEVLGFDNKWHTTNKATIWRWRNAYQNDFAARMDWTIKPYKEANHPPRPALGHTDRLSAKAGERVPLSAAGSTDPDGDTLNYQWIVYGEAGEFTTATARTGNAINIEDSNKQNAILVVPDKRIFKTGDLHVILAVTDNGSPQLTRYKRVIINIRN